MEWQLPRCSPEKDATVQQLTVARVGKAKKRSFSNKTKLALQQMSKMQRLESKQFHETRSLKANLSKPCCQL